MPTIVPRSLGSNLVISPIQYLTNAGLLARIIHRVFIDQPKGASPMPLTLCFREPVGASPGPEFAGEFA